MNRWVRLFFLPIMLLAGVFTGFMCALIVSPIALCHRLRQIRSNAADIARYQERCRRMHTQLYGPGNAATDVHTIGASAIGASAIGASAIGAGTLGENATRAKADTATQS